MGQAFRRTGAVAGIAYALLVTIENLDVLEAPSHDSSASDIVAAYSAPTTKLAIFAVCGTLSLLAYLLAAVALWTVVRERDDESERAWSVLGLAGAVVGPAVGLVALSAHTALVRGVDGQLSDDLVRLLHDVRLGLQTLGALPVGLFLIGSSLAGRRGRRLPWWLWAPGLAVGVGAVAVSGTAVASGAVQRALVLAALAAATGWLLAVSVWLLLRDWPAAAADTPWMTTARILAGTVAVAAGVSGLALLGWPASTELFFSWGLVPPPLAALIGGFYVASSVVYGRATTATWEEVRVLVVGILALTVPVFAATLAHLDVFDFGRLAAWLWVILFAAFPVGATVALVGQRGRSRPGDGTHFRVRSRLIAAGLTLVLAAVSVALWLDPADAGGALLPFTPSPLGGRVLGGWTLLLAVLAGWVAGRGLVVEGRQAVWAHVAFPAGALLGGLRTLGDLAPAGARALYLAVLVAWLALGLVMAVDAGRGPGPVVTTVRPRTRTRVPVHQRD